jgi:tetratricopeptide (TPR) repeat protein
VKYLAQELLDLIRKQLNKNESELISVIPLPSMGDRLQRLKALEEVISQLKNTHDFETEEYLIQIRKKKPESNSIKASLESIYLSNGKLNLPYLMKNADLLFASGEYSSARKIYTTIQQSGECTALALFKIGSCYEKEGKFNEARIKYEESLAYHPSPECYQRIASISVQQIKNLKTQKNLEKVTTPRRVELLKLK